MPKLVRSSSSDPKYFRTRGGHMLLMEDGTGRKIELIDASGDNSVVIDTEANSITVKSGGDVIDRPQPDEIHPSSTTVRRAETVAPTTSGAPEET